VRRAEVRDLYCEARRADADGPASGDDGGSN
jgi:hypothetical protein